MLAAPGPPPIAEYTFRLGETGLTAFANSGAKVPRPVPDRDHKMIWLIETNIRWGQDFRIKKQHPTVTTILNGTWVTESDGEDRLSLVCSINYLNGRGYQLTTSIPLLKDRPFALGGYGNRIALAHDTEVMDTITSRTIWATLLDPQTDK
jgi:hypothetical protein